MRHRFVYCSEANDGRPLNADLMKRFSGGDKQSARDLYGSSKQISDRVPAFMPFLASNDDQVPEIEGADAALRERIIPFWFANTRPWAQRTPDFAQKLVTAESSGILNYAIEGYLDVIRNPGIIRELPEECVKAGKLIYRALNVQQRWAAEETEIDYNENRKQEWLTIDESWVAYTEWCEEQREKSGTKTKFGSVLAAAGHGSGPVHVPAALATKKNETVRRRKGLVWSEAHKQRFEGPAAGCEQAKPES